MKYTLYILKEKAGNGPDNHLVTVDGVIGDSNDPSVYPLCRRASYFEDNNIDIAPLTTTALGMQNAAITCAECRRMFDDGLANGDVEQDKHGYFAFTFPGKDVVVE